ncbi:DUF1570 domain-containing protein [Pseudoalteromonas sp. MMG013]|uniref:DUF1570 domain-containing protein n=1 Tax=Pseudoalteromonas sp. MMG013 TaxID=2822687 RepID=UPI001B379B32|nr:DUF1570 domain-containing protein [Pseudoalteromonas sp. MMG013]MBQ4864727.1 DUF1570 domain-containing protein [Pseudoalteromonas sp. MMG013]
MQRWTRFIMITVLVITSISLSYFFSNRQFWFSSLHTQPAVTEPTKISEFHVSQPSVILSKESTYIHNNHKMFRKSCEKADLGAVKYEQVDGIYTWVDERGIKNFSDKKPHSAAELYQTTKNNTLDYFELNVQAGGLPVRFKNQLSANLRAVFRAYATLVGLKVMRKVKLNLHILPNTRAYNHEVKSLGGDPTGTTGVYFGSKNTAYIKYSTFEHTIKVAVHEAVHAINEAVIGDTPQWFNEGLAEYFEYTHVHMQASIIEPNKSWVSLNGRLLKSVIQPRKLVHTSSHWRKSNYAQMYRSSWAFVYFLTSDDTRKSLLRKYLLAEQSNKCDTLGNDQVWTYLTARQGNLEQAFVHFTKSKLTAHRY